MFAGTRCTFDGFRFQEQAWQNGCEPSNFHKALEEAFLAENGFLETLMQEIDMAAGRASCFDSISRGAQEATGSNQYQELHHHSQASLYLLLAY